MKIIQLDLKAMQDICPVNESLERKAQLQQQKNAVYRFRNELLTASLQKEITAADFAVTEFGKPYLPDFPSFYFNHSHSKNNYVLASSQRVRELGVDVEDLNRNVRFEALAAHAFHVEEIQHWKAEQMDREYWFKVWTAKEAILKAAGLGIRMNLNELNIQLAPHASGGVCSHAELGVFAYQHYVAAGSVLAVAWRSEQSCRGFNFPTIQLTLHS